MSLSRWLRRLALAVLLIAAVAFLVQGANRPPDPSLRSDGGDARAAPEGFGQIGIRITTAEGVAEDGCTLLAATDETRSRGLMERRDLDGYDGMLFRFAAPTNGSFYMRNTPMPLSIAFFDGDGIFVSDADMAPCDDVEDCPTYAAEASYLHALEVPQGTLDDLGASEGAVLTFPDGTADPCVTDI